MKNSMILAVLLLCVASRVSAVMGVGDVVIVASNPAQELLWAANELPKWIEMIDKAQEQVNKAKEMVDVVGHPEKFAGRVLSASAPALEATQLAKALKSDAAVIQTTRDTWNLGTEVVSLKNDALNVQKNYRVFGKEVSRKRERYLNLAVEKGLRSRIKQAIDHKRNVDKKEIALQEDTLSALQNARAQTEIGLHQAALTASQQRVELAAGEVRQAELELQNFVGDTEIDTRKQLEEAKERSETSAGDAAIIAGELESRSILPPVPEPIPSAKDWDPFKS